MSEFGRFAEDDVLSDLIEDDARYREQMERFDRIMEKADRNIELSEFVDPLTRRRYEEAGRTDA